MSGSFVLSAIPAQGGSTWLEAAEAERTAGKVMKRWRAIAAPEDEE